MDKYRVIVAGSRDFSNYRLLAVTLHNLFLSIEIPIMIVSGGARGADRLGERYARDHGYEIDYHPANWDLYGKSAGFRRNKEMAECADALIAFWDGRSKGTKHMISTARRYGLKVTVIDYSYIR